MDKWKPKPNEKAEPVLVTSAVQTALSETVAKVVASIHGQRVEFDVLQVRLLEQWAQHVAGHKFPPAIPLRVWWTPQVPMNSHFVEIESLAQAGYVLDFFARYDLWLFENNLKPDYTNAGGLEEWEEEGWVDWESEDGEDFDEWWEQNQAQHPFTSEIEEWITARLYEYDAFQGQNRVKDGVVRHSVIRKFVSENPPQPALA